MGEGGSDDREEKPSRRVIKKLMAWTGSRVLLAELGGCR